MNKQIEEDPKITGKEDLNFKNIISSKFYEKSQLIYPNTTKNSEEKIVSCRFWKDRINK